MSIDELEPREPTFAEKWALDFRLVALNCAASYGSLAVAALIGLNALGWALVRADLFAVGAVLGVISAAAAYANFTGITQDAPEKFVFGTMVAALGAGVASGVLFLVSAL